MTSTSKKACSTGIGSQIMEIVFMYIYILDWKGNLPRQTGVLHMIGSVQKKLTKLLSYETLSFRIAIFEKQRQSTPQKLPLTGVIVF